jgi:uncharacterized protein
MKLHYLEIVTPDVQSICYAYEASLNINFSAPDPSLGEARTALLETGATLGIRAPLRDTEAPIIRPYWLVENIDAALTAAAKAGAKIALPPTEIPGRGKIAIYIQGQIDHGLWQL